MDFSLILISREEYKMDFVEVSGEYKRRPGGTLSLIALIMNVDRMSMHALSLIINVD